MRIIFVRHGEPDYDRDALLPAGIREAEALKPRVESWDIDEIYISPLRRARQTAKIALGLDLNEDFPDHIDRGAKRVPLQVVEWAREFDNNYIRRPDMNGGEQIAWDWLPADWTGQDILYDKDRWLEHPVFAESIVPEKYRRMTEGFDTMLARHGYVRDGRKYRVENGNHDTVVLFTHYGITCVLLSHLLSVSPMPLWHGVCMSPTSVTCITTEERRKGIASFRTNYIGDTSHLAAAGIEFNRNALFTEVYGDDDRYD